MSLMHASVLSISGRQRVLHSYFEKKTSAFRKSDAFFLHPDFDKNVQEFPPGCLFKKKKKNTKGLTCEVTSILPLQRNEGALHRVSNRIKAFR